MKNLLKLQGLDGRIQHCKSRETEIPKQKKKFNIQRERLDAELAEREEFLKALTLEQRDCETTIEQLQEQIAKYNGQLNLVKKNEEYQALLHEIDQVKKQIGQREERILAILVESDDAAERLEEDRKRIKAEKESLDRECKAIDKELEEAVSHRNELEAQRQPLIDAVADDLVSMYERLRKKSLTGPFVVPLKDEVCGGCHMHLLAQTVNEILAGNKLHTCRHCGRILYAEHNVRDEAVEESTT